MGRQCCGGLRFRLINSLPPSFAAGRTISGTGGLDRTHFLPHMGFQQEAYDAECPAIARALETATPRSLTHERITIFTDA